jgi:hypothetical protein
MGKGRVPLMRRRALIIVLLMLPCFLSAQERPFALWLTVGGGVVSERNEQFSPLVYTGGVFHAGGGWLLQGEHLVWYGSFSWSAGSLTGPVDNGLSVRSSITAGRTALLYNLPFRPLSTRISIGPSFDFVNLYDSMSRNGDVDEAWSGFAGFGPSLLLENHLLERFVFRLWFSLPLAALAFVPAWGSHPQGFPESGDMADVLQAGEWVFFSELQLWSAGISCGFRLGKYVELVGIWSLTAESFDRPYRSGRIANTLSVGLEFDMGRVRP